MLTIKSLIMPRSPWWAVAGLAAGALLNVVSMLTDDYRDKTATVVTMQGDVIYQDDRVLRVHLYGVKSLECDYGGIQAFFAHPTTGLLVETDINRVDMPERRITKPLGKFDLGIWEAARPPLQSKKFLIFVNHKCGAYARITRIADLDINKSEVSTDF